MYSSAADVIVIVAEKAVIPSNCDGVCVEWLVDGFLFLLDDGL